MEGRKCARSIGGERMKVGFEGRNKMKEVMVGKKQWRGMSRRGTGREQK